MRRYLAPTLLLLSVLLSGWTHITDNFFGVALAPAAWTNVSDQSVPIFSGTSGKWSTTAGFTAITNASSGTLLGRTTAGSGSVEQITPSADFSLAALALGLSSTGVTAGSDGDATHVGTFTVDAKGRLTAAGSTAISGLTNTAISNTAAIALTKLANASANSKLLGSGASGAGSSYAELTLGTNLSITGTTINASAGSITGKSAGSTVDAAVLNVNVDGTSIGMTSGPAGTVTLAIPSNGVTSAAIAAQSVGISKMTMNTAKLLGRTTASAGAAEEVGVDATLTLSAVTLGVASGGVGTTQLANSGVTLAKIANATANSKWLGAGSAGSGAAYTENSFNSTNFVVTGGLLAIATSGITNTCIAAGAVTDSSMAASTLTVASMAASVTNRLFPALGNAGRIPFENSGGTAAANNSGLAWDTTNNNRIKAAVHQSTGSAGAPAGAAVGDSYYDTTQKCFMVDEDILSAKPLCGLLYSITADSSDLGNATTNTTFSNATFTVPANAWTAGKRVHIKASSKYSDGANPFLNYAVYFQGNLLGTVRVTAGSAQSNKTVNLDAVVTCRATGAASTATFQTMMWMCCDQGSDTQSTQVSQTNLATGVNTTSSGALSVAAAFGSSNASNHWTLTDLQMEVEN